MEEPYRVGDDVYVIPSSFAFPGIGILPINAFLVTAREPVLVDTGIGVFKEAFLSALSSIIDPSDIRWVWMTHDDIDHTGSIEEVMSLAPDATILTHALCALRMSGGLDVAPQRVRAIRAGDSVDVGDRRLIAVVPPLFDNPMSIGLFDDKSRSFFTVDSFGAILGSSATDAKDIPDDALVGGMTAWATFDSPWTRLVEKAKFGDMLRRVREVNARTLFSSHLPPATDMTDRLITVLESLPDAPPFIAPDNEAYQQIVRRLPAAR
jgi:ODP family beta lactamase